MVVRVVKNINCNIKEFNVIDGYFCLNNAQ